MERNRRRLFETPFPRRRTRTTFSLPVSIGLHVVLLGAIVLVPLLISQELPEVGDFHQINGDVIPVITPPPPPPAASRGKGSTNTRHPAVPSSKKSPDFKVPTHVSEIQPDLDLMDGISSVSQFGVDGGFDIGQDYTPIFRNVVNKHQETKIVHRVGGFIKPPSRIRYTAPEYPQLARNAKIQGQVKIRCAIDEMGRVVDMQVVKSIPLLDEAALAAVSQWRYNPTLLNGVAVAISMEVTVDFQLR